MNGPWVTIAVMLSAYALASLLLSGAVAALLRLRPPRAGGDPDAWLAVRLAPSAGAGFIVLAVVLPAFLRFEPAAPLETVAAPLGTLAALGLALLAGGAWRGVRAWLGSRAWLRGCAVLPRRVAGGDAPVIVVDAPVPLVAVVGTRQPVIIAARAVLAGCSPAEFNEVIAHERAHIRARDNLKLLALRASPDALAWLPVARRLERGWRVAAEYAADEAAVGAAPDRRLELASALVKIARLASGAPPPVAAGLAASVDDVEGRVRRLLQPSGGSAAGRTLRRAALLALTLPAAALPLYAPIHALLEQLVEWGR
ncbi:MAG: hypothetical protein JSR54_13350 [Proteobacteria bacterium]|nr:hypothetical protein [Pseudomonadota bacterium]